jgi:hypothetical protein
MFGAYERDCNFIALSGPLSVSWQNSWPVNDELYLPCYASYTPDIFSLAQEVIDVPWCIWSNFEEKSFVCAFGSEHNFIYLSRPLSVSQQSRNSFIAEELIQRGGMLPNIEK